MNNRIITREMRRQLERDNAKQPSILTPIPKDQWPDLSSMEKQPNAVWRSRFHLVQAFEEAGGATRLSVNRTSVSNNGRWDEGMAWDELQMVKRQVGFGDYYAIEIYPRDRDIVNVSNMRHLWVMRDPLPIGWFKS